MFGFIHREVRAVPAQQAGTLVGCFGKLPLHSEFIRHNLALREAAALERWVQDGVALMIRRYDDGARAYLSSGPTVRFVITNTAEERTLVGLLAPNHDKSGRAYPFGVFAALDDPLLSEFPAAIPVACQGFLGAAARLTSLDTERFDLKRLIAAVDATGATLARWPRRDLLTAQLRMLEGVPIETFWDELMPGSEERSRVQLVRAVVSTLRQAARRYPSRVSWGLRLPLPSRRDATPYVVFWIQLANSLLSGRSWRAHYFWREAAPGAPARLHMFFRPVPPSYLGTVVGPLRSDGSFVDVMEELANEAAGAGLGSEYLRVQNLADAVDRWRGLEP